MIRTEIEPPIPPSPTYHAKNDSSTTSTTRITPSPESASTQSNVIRTFAKRQASKHQQRKQRNREQPPNTPNPHRNSLPQASNHRFQTAPKPTPATPTHATSTSSASSPKPQPQISKQSPAYVRNIAWNNNRLPCPQNSSNSSTTCGFSFILQSLKWPYACRIVSVPITEKGPLCVSQLPASFLSRSHLCCRFALSPPLRLPQSATHQSPPCKATNARTITQPAPHRTRTNSLRKPHQRNGSKL